MLKNGIFLVRFDSVMDKDAVIERCIYHFDNKPFIAKAQYPDRVFTREELLNVPIWVKFPELDFKYWSQKGLSKIDNLVGKSLMVDQCTEKKMGLNLTRLVVERDMIADLPEIVLFRNEKGLIVQQMVQYDWKPILCKHCGEHEHCIGACRKKHSVKAKEPTTYDQNKLYTQQDRGNQHVIDTVKAPQVSERAQV